MQPISWHSIARFSIARLSIARLSPSLHGLGRNHVRLGCFGGNRLTRFQHGDGWNLVEARVLAGLTVWCDAGPAQAFLPRMRRDLRPADSHSHHSNSPSPRIVHPDNRFPCSADGHAGTPAPAARFHPSRASRLIRTHDLKDVLRCREQLSPLRSLLIETRLLNGLLVSRAGPRLAVDVAEPLVGAGA